MAVETSMCSHCRKDGQERDVDETSSGKREQEPKEPLDKNGVLSLRLSLTVMRGAMHRAHHARNPRLLTSFVPY